MFFYIFYFFRLVPGDACKPPRFNAAALSPDECRECFCMAVTEDCQSASLYKKQVYMKRKCVVVDHIIEFIQAKNT